MFRSAPLFATGLLCLGLAGCAGGSAAPTTFDLVAPRSFAPGKQAKYQLVVNEPTSTGRLADSVELVLGEEGVVATTQSLGGEDFGWFLESVPGAMARLGTRTPGGPMYDLHQGNMRIDERAVPIGARVMATVAYETLTKLAQRAGSSA